jgi:hypothetical protein
VANLLKGGKILSGVTIDSDVLAGATVSPDRRHVTE